MNLLSPIVKRRYVGRPSFREIDDAVVVTGSVWWGSALWGWGIRLGPGSEGRRDSQEALHIAHAAAKDFLVAMRQTKGLGRPCLVVDGNNVALEVDWSATLAIPVSTLHAGETMRARFAIFIEMKDGKIFRQRNYDCFEPW